MIYLVTFCDDKMTKSAALCCGSAMKYGVDVIWPQNPDTISHDFMLMNKDILTQERGAGYWLWKPYHIYKALLNAKEGDYVIYADAGVEFVNNVSEIINRMTEDIFFFTNGWPHYDWTKKKVLNAILPDTWMDYWKDRKPLPQVQASVIFFKVNQRTRDFVKEWLLFCQFPGFIDDTPSTEGESEQAGFQEHRHDQSILCCLQVKYGYKLHWWPTTYSMHLERSSEDSYPVMFNHHRKRNNEW
jgi:hypothetical protein